MTFLHMHHAMANKALSIESSKAKDYWKIDKVMLRNIVMSGAVDYKDRWQPVTVTIEDRETVCRFLDC